MLDSLMASEGFHRCLICKASVSTNEAYLRHMKDHFTEYRTPPTNSLLTLGQNINNSNNSSELLSDNSLSCDDVGPVTPESTSHERKDFRSPGMGSDKSSGISSLPGAIPNRPTGLLRVKRLRKKRPKAKQSPASKRPFLVAMAGPGGEGAEARPTFASEDECLGDSEMSDSSSSCRFSGDEDDEVGSNRGPASETTWARLQREKEEMRRLLARTRLSLAEQQLESPRSNGGTGEPADELVCLTCLKRFSNMQNLRRHLRLHISRDSHIPECDMLAADATADNNNRGDPIYGSGTKARSPAAEDVLPRFTCDFCPERFANKAAAAVHEKTHADQPTECYVCNKRYADRYTLRYHLRTHGIGHQIRCELCNKSFTKPSRLRSHVDTFHKNIRNFGCSRCDKAFKTRLHLDNHFLQHTGEKPHRCSDCGESFRHKVSLVAHQRIHANLRPYVCEECGKSFREPSTMNAHMRVHSGDRPYKCDMCDKSFTQRAGLNYHKRVHSGVKPFKCGQCDYATAKQASLKNHLRAIHKLVVNVNVKNSQVINPREILPAELPQEGLVPLQHPHHPQQAEQQHQPPHLQPGLDGNLGMHSMLLTGGGHPSSSHSIQQAAGKSGSVPPLPSPPLQPGDALLPHMNQHQAVFQSSGHGGSTHSLPSFNILKSFEMQGNSGAIHGPMGHLVEEMKAGNGGLNHVASDEKAESNKSAVASLALQPSQHSMEPGREEQHHDHFVHHHQHQHHHHQQQHHAHHHAHPHPHHPQHPHHGHQMTTGVNNSPSLSPPLTPPGVGQQDDAYSYAAAPSPDSLCSAGGSPSCASPPSTTPSTLPPPPYNLSAGAAQPPTAYSYPSSQQQQQQHLSNNTGSSANSSGPIPSPLNFSISDGYPQRGGANSGLDSSYVGATGGLHPDAAPASTDGYYSSAAAGGRAKYLGCQQQQDYCGAGGVIGGRELKKQQQQLTGQDGNYEYTAYQPQHYSSYSAGHYYRTILSHQHNTASDYDY